MRRIAFLLCAVLVLPFARAAEPAAAEFNGQWVWETEGRVLLTLSLSVGDGGQLGGRMERPRAMQLAPSRAGIAVSEISGPLYSAPLREVRRSALGRVMAYAGPDGAARESLVRPNGQGGLLLVFFAAEPDGMQAALRRVDDPVTVSLQWEPDRTYFLRNAPAVPNAELVDLHAADQSDRRGAQDAAKVAQRDAARRTRVRQLMDQGLLRAADDYYRAAVIYQSGSKPDDFLLAHVLAMAAMALGRGDAGAIASATLDRYLWSQDKPQVLGTQYAGEAGKLGQGAYAAALIPDSLRLVLGVPSRADQAAQARQINRDLQDR